MILLILSNFQLLIQVHSSTLINYKFGKNFGQVFFDYSESDNHGQNGETIGSDIYDTIATDRGAYFLSTSNTYIKLPPNEKNSNAIKLGNLFSMIIWVKPLDKTDYYLSHRSFNNSELFWVMRFDSGNYIKTQIKRANYDSGQISGDTSVIISECNLNIGSWSLISIINENKSTSFYINSILSLTLTQTSVYQESYSQEHYLGYKTSSFQGFIWSFLLSDDIQSISNFYSINHTVNYCLVPTCPSSCSPSVKEDDLQFCLSLSNNSNTDGQGNICSSCKNGCFGSICLDCYESSCIIDGVTNKLFCIPELSTASTCKCDELMFFSYDYMSCMDCHSDCKTCDKENSCVECFDANSESGIVGCKCKMGFYNVSALVSDGLCLKCKSGCKDCASDKNCTECLDENSIVQDGGCICKSGYFNTTEITDDGDCLMCHSDCKFCNDKFKCISCLDPHSVLELTVGCKCFQNYFKSNSMCEICDLSCLTCYNSTFYTCLSCQNFKLYRICFDICPYGYISEEKNCEKNSKVDLIYFGQFSTLELQSSNLNLENCSNKNSKFPNIFYQKGYYFDGESSCFELVKENKERFLFSVEFLFIIWLKPLASNSTLFRVSDQDNKSYFDIYLKFSNIIAKILIDSEEYMVEYSDEVINKWTSLYFELDYSNFSTIKLFMDTNQIISSTVSESPFIEAKNSIYQFSDEKTFKGFIYLIELHKSFYPKYLNIKDYLLCNETFKDCIDNCNINQFFDQTISECSNCSRTCDQGCRSKTHCGICRDSNCLSCDSFETNSCLKCESGYFIYNNTCTPCESLEIFDACLNCIEVCSLCLKSERCLKCKAESSNCACKYGFVFESGVCKRGIFELYLKLESNKVVLFEFSQGLLNDLISNDFLLKINDKTLKKEVAKISKQEYKVTFNKENHKDDSFICIVFLNEIISSNNFILDNKTFIAKLPKSYQNDYAILEETKNYANTGNTITVGVTLSFSLMSFDLSSFFDFLNIAELISAISLFGLNISDSYLELLINLRVQKNLPRALSKAINPPASHSAIKKYHRYGMDSQFILVNTENSLFFLGIIIILFIFQKILMKILEEKFPKLVHIKNYFEYNIFFKFWLQTSFEFMIATTYSFSLFDPDTKYSIYDLSISLVVLVIFIKSFQIFFFITSIKISFQRKKIENSAQKTIFESKFAFLFEDIKHDQFPFIFLYFYIRRLLISVLIYFNVIPIILLIISAILSISVLDI